MIERAHDSDLVNRLVGGGADFGDFLAEPLHVCLVEDENAAFFAWRGPGVYELHLAFADRGKAAVALLMRMLEAMRAQYGARWFWAVIPEQSRHVRLFARWMGWKSLGPITNRQGLNELFVSENV